MIRASDLETEADERLGEFFCLLTYKPEDERQLRKLLMRMSPDERENVEAARRALNRLLVPATN